MSEFEAFYKDNYDRHVAIIRRIVGSDEESAKDIVHDAYEKALRYLDNFDPEKGEFHKWFNKIMYNTLRGAQKKFKLNLSEEYIEELHLPDEDPEKEFDLMLEINREKNPKVRGILNQFFIKGYTSKEIAHLNEGMTITNVTTICHRFKDKMVKMYGEDFKV